MKDIERQMKIVMSQILFYYFGRYQSLTALLLDTKLCVNLF